MPVETATQACGELQRQYTELGLHRPTHCDRHEAGTELTYEVTGVVPNRPATVRLRIERFVGGGFAGQVYQVQVLSVDAPEGPLTGLAEGGMYAMKILVPPSQRARKFRDAIYRLGFQAPFQLQVNPTAARAGALWQKFIRRAAGIRLGSERAVCDVLATFVDSRIGSCGELSEWIDGRVWRYEVDAHVVRRWHSKRWKDHPHEESPEYLAKRRFMADVVRLLHELGAPELARQYEWWTCKSQPNVLKRSDTDDDPDAGLTAVDFRAGLALLAVLPMSPRDIPLIVKGLARGSLVQFDRGNVDRLREFVAAHAGHFAGMDEALEELARAERTYRLSQLDLTHNLPKLAYSGEFYATLRRAAVDTWETTGRVDAPTASRLRRNVVASLLFGLVGLAARVSGWIGWVGLIVGGVMAWRGGWAWPWPAPVTWWLAAAAVPIPLALKLLRRLWGRADFRRHAGALLTRPGYLLRTFAALNIERQVRWIRAGRVSPARGLWLASHSVWSLANCLLAFLPAKLHRLLTDRAYAGEVLRYIFVRPVRLFFNVEAREQWLRDMLAEGRRHHMLSEEDAATIKARIKDPFIQKYLKSLAVHVCTLPISQLVALIVAGWYCVVHHIPPGDAWKVAITAIAIVQVVPISPGSLTRGLYVLYLVIRERNFKDYNIAVFLGFCKYVGYLSFPIQMTYRYPALARFMAAHWATGAVHVVPVFGERGALLEHFVFDLFYNYPLSLRRRHRLRQAERADKPARRWHALPVAALGGAAVAGIAAWHMRGGVAIGLKPIWYAVLACPLAVGLATALWAGGMPTGRRIVLAVLAGLGAALAHATLYTWSVVNLAHAPAPDAWAVLACWLRAVAWPAFLFPLLALAGGGLAELSIPESPDAPLAPGSPGDRAAA